MNNKGALLSHSVEIEIPFHDCDPMNVVWHGNYPRYLEIARCELLRIFDYDYLQMKDSGFAWPIVDMQIKYVASAVFTQKIKVAAYLKEYENRLRIDYVITDAISNKRITKASTTQVAVEISSKEMQFVSPPILYEKLAPFLK
ncbi:acyl-CoA thioesterase (plasmid) [Pseudoalteromonas sp. HL-AS2]|uniref:Thioesterase domain-containing protein n=1 Tax=Pseudoalteromonas translucida (strain TAC 125) TaxID=326442 RepID=Q3IC65_PSET1|nr:MULTISPECIES: acyl-CoA thioesterase [Pseudoalteromonas]MBB1372017.1 acyl-CoA thioesterase [Pseudoalteromonas sp. SR45-4]MBB1405036.1 acyl-CoA thioesterase [Pseudoalteromonas sp. SG44-5]MBE0420849.1 acyl-CoA thioesterase [Pseudoalteromonas nigrifaciens]MBH0072088.1 acyl-CoA thioesterase [Pseudoalteromonas sp. NZS127]MBH0091516.1 acyl-CoA thioesterase [Pseudoalteromonas sp. SCQQ13]|tara:strand:- start:1536 stop:1964 length:429 start_codon:yes stop_codon:yes gene_type:complete